MATLTIFATSAASATSKPINWFLLVIGLLGGLALFLYGLDKMSDSLKLVAGDRLRKVLGRLTQNRWTGLLTGAFATGLTQSSSITTVLLVGFVSAGLITVQQSVAVVMGSNVGTTITGQLAAFQLAQYTLLVVAVGWAGTVWAPREGLRLWSRALLGLGLLFVGMEFMSQAMKPLQSAPGFINWMGQMRHAWLGMLAGAVFTALVQSSSATVGVIIALASQGLLDLKAGLAIALGANVGTCITAVLASIRQNAEARQVAVVHILFNMVGVLLFLPFLGMFADLVKAISPSSTGLQGLARIAADAPRQIANAHTLFNITCALLFIGLTRWLAWLAERISPLPTNGAHDNDDLKYMDDTYLTEPATALTMARREIGRFGHRLMSMLQLLPALHGDDPRDAQDQIRKLGGRVGLMHQRMSSWLTQLSHETLTPEQAAELLYLLRVINAYQNMATRITQDLLRLDWVNAAKQRRDKEQTYDSLHNEIQERLELSTLLTLRAVVDSDAEAAKQALDLRDQIDKYAQQAQIESLASVAGQAQIQDHDPAFLEIQSLDLLKQLHYFNRRIARGQLRLAEENPA